MSAEIPSPDAEVIEGGINFSSVTIRLKQLEEGHSSCRVLVCGKLCTTGPSAEESEQVHSLLCVTCCTAAVTILDSLLWKFLEPFMKQETEKCVSYDHETLACRSPHNSLY